MNGKNVSNIFEISVFYMKLETFANKRKYKYIYVNIIK